MKRDAKGRFVKATKKIKIEFQSWAGRAAIEIEAENVREAVEKAVADGENLNGALLNGASLNGASLNWASLNWASLDGASLNGASLNWASLDGASLNGASLDGASLNWASLDGASLDGASLNGKPLWKLRPVLQLGPCGSVGRTTVVFFFEDGSEPLIRCGCFTGTIAEFRAKIYDTHAGTFHESEYNALSDHIDEMYAIQQEELKAQKENEGNK